MERFVDRVNGFGPREHAPAATRAGVLAMVREVAERVDPSGCDGESEGYARCVLHEDPSGWSLAAIVLRPGQATPPHDHGGWGGAVTVSGLERDRRFVGGAPGDLVPVEERDYPPGAGYLFDPDDVHQPIGADPGGVTVSLHFLAPHTHQQPRRLHEGDWVGAEPSARDVQ